MIKWKTAVVELVAIGLVAGAGWFYFHPRPSAYDQGCTTAPCAAEKANTNAPVTAPVTDPKFDNNAAGPTDTAPMPPKGTASPIRTRHHGMRPEAISPTRSHAGKRGSPDFWVGRPRAARRSDFCKQIPAIAYNFDRATIIQAMRKHGVSEAKQAQVLACLNK